MIEITDVSQTMSDVHFRTTFKLFADIDCKINSCKFQVFTRIKYLSSIQWGAVHFFDLLKRARDYCTEDEFAAVAKTLQINSFFAHPENIILSMCCKFNSLTL